MRDENDSYERDNDYYIYGGERQPLRVQYCSSQPNNFFSGVLRGLRQILASKWSLGTPSEVVGLAGAETTGYDLYIYEHIVPTELPTDGVILIMDPPANAEGLGITFGGMATGEFQFDLGQTHPITKGVTAADIMVTAYQQIRNQDGYDQLLYINGSPVMLAKNEPNLKIVVLPFSINRSNLAVLPEFPLLMYNLVEYYFPATLTEYVYEVNEPVTLNARGPELSVEGPGTNMMLDTFPSTISFTVPGMYTLKQVPISGELVTENCYVKIPASESNIFQQVELLEDPYLHAQKPSQDRDLLIYLAAALVLLLFAEWWLQTREQF